GRGRERLRGRHSDRGRAGGAEPGPRAAPRTRCGRGDPVRRMGPRRSGAARRGDGAAAPQRTPADVAEPARRPSGLRAADARDAGGGATYRRAAGRQLAAVAGRAGCDIGGDVKDVLDDITTWSERGDRVALATVVGFKRSAPRPPGSKMAVNEHGDISGGVSGGCVEGAVATI